MPCPRILFIRNSILLMNDLPGVVQRLAKAEGIYLSVGLAAAYGAWLTETIRIYGLAEVMNTGWGVTVVQDFTRTSLRAWDRWALARAVNHIADAVAPSQILLCPPFPQAAGAQVYRNAGFLATQPDSPTDYAARTMAHYQLLGHPFANLPGPWLEAVAEGAPLYHRDGHHPSEAGTEFMAKILWGDIQRML